MLCSCTNTSGGYYPPQKYYAECEVTAYYGSDSENIKYNMKILKEDKNIKIIIDYNNVNFLVDCSNGKCTLINKKFNDSKIECDLTVLKYLVEEISLEKFVGLKSKADNTVELENGLYRYVLKFEKGTNSPRKVLIYKENSLYKNFEYKNIKLYK